MDGIISRLQQLKTGNLTSHIHSKFPSSSLQGLEEAVKHLSPQGQVSGLLPPSFSDEFVSLDFARLRVLDERLEQHIQLVIQQLDELTSPDPSALVGILHTLEDEQRWLGDCIAQLDGLQEHHDQATQIYVLFMQERVAEFKAGVDLYLHVLYDRSSAPTNPNVVQTGNHLISVIP